MNVEIGAEAALFPEKEYMNGIAVAGFYKNLPFLKILPWDIEEKYTWICLQSTPKLLSLKKGPNYEKD